MRAAAFCLLAVLAACGREEAGTPEGEAAIAQAEAAPRVACAKGSAELAPDCTVERAQGENGLTLTIRHPDGAFRRLLVTTDGRGVVAADGAEPARVTVTGANEIDVVVADERYRLPATVQGQSPAR